MAKPLDVLRRPDQPGFRTRTYHASLTPERLVVLSAVGLACIAMIGYGIGANMAGSSSGNGFMGLGLLLLVLAGVALGRTHQRSLKISEDALHFHLGKKSTTIPWDSVLNFEADPPARRLFRTATLTDGTRGIQVDSYTFREYDQIVSLIEIAMRTHWKGAGRPRAPR